MILSNNHVLANSYPGCPAAYGDCIVCGLPFTFNPVRVPSITVNGEREPICRPCIPFVNALRRKAGMDECVPLPDAYEACEEGELS